MRTFAKLAVLVVIMLLLTGSTVFVPFSSSEDSLAQRAQSIEQLLAEQEAMLDAYRDELRQVGEDLFTHKVGELRREQAQILQSKLNTLQTELQDAAQAEQDEIASEMLSLQLQLMLVSLTAEEREDKLEQINRLKDELADRLALLEEDFQGQLEELRMQHEEEERKATLALQTELEKVLEDEFAHYRLAMLEAFEEELRKLQPALGSALLNRSY